MTVDLYGKIGPAGCRSVLLTAKAIGVKLNMITTIPLTDDVRNPEFLKMNPQKTIPVLNDNGLYINESRAIMQYLCNKYSPSDDQYYPKLPEKRAIVDARLNFELGTLQQRFEQAYFPVLFFGASTFPPDKMKKLEEALGYLEIYLENGYVAGNFLSIADFSVVATVSTILAAGQKIHQFPKVVDYLNRCRIQIVGYEEINQKGIDDFLARFKTKLDTAWSNWDMNSPTG
ncbi:Glutathione S-transferase 1, isoform D [Folsomia candida]|uniref:Glutathione S-transferase 1, isoform D n=2 Tax=Folsomia candida TaxID=158441 RepID=A0A226EQ14_FOLCA|nr:Glutathione S-transferase 1, isoform D [Folsomia candida]